MFKALADNAALIIDAKKAEIIETIKRGLPAVGVLKVDTTKATGLSLSAGKVYPIINTTNYMDSHDDVHFPGLWNKTLSDQQGKIYYVTDHDLKVSSVIVYPSKLKAYAKTLAWSDIGLPYSGDTEALIYEFAKTDMVHAAAMAAVDGGEPVQNSVRMQYVKIQMGINSNEKDYAQYKAYFDAHVDKIVNKDRALEAGYFFGIEEAKIVREGSMVLFGSNDATPVLTAAAKGTEPIKTQPPQSTTQNAIKFINPNLY